MMKTYLTEWKRFLAEVEDTPLELQRNLREIILDQKFSINYDGSEVVGKISISPSIYNISSFTNSFNRKHKQIGRAHV